MSIARSRWIWVGLATAAVAVAAFIGVRNWSQGDPATTNGPPTARLMSAEQLANIVHDIFGDDVRVDLNYEFPRDEGLFVFGAAEAGITPGLLGQFDRVAKAIATEIVSEERRALHIPCQPQSETTPDDACAAAFFTDVGRLLFRRPLTDAERELYVSTAREMAKVTESFYDGLGHSLSVMMIAPQFLYFVERTEPDPRRDGQIRLDAYSKAARLSLFLWNSAPDDALLAAAESGELHKAAILKSEVERMIRQKELLERGVLAFFGDLMNFNQFALALAKDPVIYPAFTSSAAVAAREQIERLIVDHLLVREADYRSLYTVNETFMNPDLAPLMRRPAELSSGWTRVSLDPDKSAGLLTSIGFLAAHSHAGRSSATLRGKAIRQDLLCQKVPDPPPSVDFTGFEASFDSATARERLMAHNAVPACAGCHALIDPIGLSLENYDGAAQFRTVENDVPIDVSGDLHGAAYEDVAGLGKALHDDPTLVSCLASRLYAYGVGRKMDADDRPYLDALANSFAKEDGYRFPGLLRRIAASNAFYAVSPPETDDAIELASTDDSEARNTQQESK